MAFNSDYFGRQVVNKSTQLSSVFTYNATSTGADDTLAEVIASGYFNDLIENGVNVLQVNDVIRIIANDNFGDYYITSVTTNVTVARYGAAPVKVTTSDPTVNDDVDLGYTVGQTWVNTTDGGYFVCLDNSDGAADWNEITTS